MKARQITLLVLLLVGGIFGLTFLTQYMRRPVESANTKTIDPRAVPLRVTENVATWDESPSDSSAARYTNAEFERGTKGHYDFWVNNPNTQPVDARLYTQSCTCFDLKLGIVPAAGLAAARSAALARQTVLATALGLAGRPELGLLGAVPDVSQVVEWHPLQQLADRPGVSVTVPAADSNTGPQLGIIRFEWRVNSISPIRLTANVQHQLDKAVEMTAFEVPLAIVPPLLVAPTTMHVGDLKLNDQREGEFYIWSATRPSLNVRVEASTPDPCVEVGALVPLSEQELQELPQKLVQTGMIPRLTRMRCGYKVKITVYERRGDHQLEMGPVGRRVLIKGDNLDFGAEEPPSVAVTAFVRGPIRIGAPSDNDRIDLGAFPTKRGVDKQVVITSLDTTIGLKVVGQTPESLQVRLKEQPPGVGQKRWLLTVEVPPNTFSGPLPPDAAVRLQIDGSPPRSVRVPVIGIAMH